MAQTQELHLNGIIPVIPTPFTAEEQIDWPSLRRLVDFACATGACAMCLPAYASEFYKLSDRERLRVVAEAVQQVDGSIPVFAQVNFISITQAVESAREAQRTGAAAIAVAVPRTIGFGESDLFRYFDRILSSIDVPLLIQDVNPFGPTLTASFAAKLNRAHAHFRWIKLEEPLMGPKVVAISQETDGRVGVLEGWGGMYILDLIPAGIVGVMPGLAVADVLAKIFRLATNGASADAYEIFQAVLPQIVFSLQHIELFHHAEKRLLVARGILDKAVVRQLALGLDKHLENQISFLNRQVLALLDKLTLPHNPAVATIGSADEQ